MSSARRVVVGTAEDRERRAHVACGVERLAHPAAAPVVGEADHPVERHRACEHVAGGRLQRLHAAHAEADDVHALDAVTRHEEVGRTNEVVDLEPVVELAYHGHPGHRVRRTRAPPAPRTRTVRGTRRRSRARRTRAHRSSKSGRTPMMSGWTTTPVSARLPTGFAWIMGTSTPSAPVNVVRSATVSCRAARQLSHL